MQGASPYRALGEKFLHTDKYPEIVVPDSLLKLLPHLYTEEEAQVVLSLREGMQSARAVARRLHRPVGEVRPLLQSLAERLLILGVGPRGHALYGTLALYPFLYDAQMILCERQMREEGEDGAWHREFIALYRDFLDEFYGWLGPREVASRYQLLGLPFGRIISVEQAIDATPGLGILAFSTDRYSEMVDRAKKSLCLVNVCTCRFGKHLLGEGCGRLANTCSCLGLPAEGAIKAGAGRRVSREEFLDAKLRATEAGLVHMTDNVLDPMIACSCCTCCCEVLGILRKFNSPAALTRSHFEAVVDTRKCTGCGTCVDRCPMDAIALVEQKGAALGNKKTAAAGKGAAVRKAAAAGSRSGTKKAAARRKASIDYQRCIGCGVCVTGCDRFKALTLRERKVYTPPADNMAEAWARRYFELRGRENDLLPRLTLGAARVLGTVSPIHVTGPRALSFGRK